MTRLTTCKESALAARTLEALEPVRLNGQLADVYLQFANSQPALRAYLAMEDSLRNGSLKLREIEGIKLLVSELTQCEYCLAVHSFKARQAGLDRSMQLLLRSGQNLGEARLDAILSLVRSLFGTPGTLSDEALKTSRLAGISDANLVDITLAMSTIFFTNMTNHINHSQSSLPPAPSLEPVAQG